MDHNQSSSSNRSEGPKSKVSLQDLEWSVTQFKVKDEADPSRNVDNNPYIIKKQTETNLIVEDGETIVISGLTKQKTTENTNGVPWLKDIPLLGWLFKGEGTSDNMQEVLIFITPTIMKPQEVAGIQTGS